MRRLRRCKIVATLGPVSTPDEMLARLFEAGVDMFRINMSHTSHDDLRARVFALRNVAKHCGEAPARIALTKSNNALQLTVEDAGPGYDMTLARRAGGLGLLSMQERARLVGGSMLLRTAPGEDTQVIVRVPLNEGAS